MIPAVIGSIAAKHRAAGGGDPYFANVVALLHLDGADGSTTFTDEKGNTFSPTFGTPATISTAESRFGGASLLLDGANEGISTGSSTDWEFGSGDFTIEMFIRPSATISSRMELVSRWASYGVILNAQATGVLRGLITTSIQGNVIATGTTVISASAWHHIALVRNGSALNLYMDGLMEATASLTSAIDAISSSMGIGVDVNVGSNTFSGNIDEIRITKGVARYSGSTYTVPTASFPNS